MTIGRNADDERADEAGWPWSHRKTFLEGLATQGYAAVTIQEYRTIAGRFCDAIEKRGLQMGHLDSVTTERLRHSVLSGVTGSARTYAKFCARRFIDHLIEVGAALKAPPAKKLTALDRLREDYETYLRQQRGLAESTIENCRLYMRRFIAFRFGDNLGNLNAITPDDIVAFLGKLKAGSHPHRYRSVPSQLRNFFTFLFWSGKTKRDLARSLSRVAPPKADSLPRDLNPQEIGRLIEAQRTNETVGRRNYAMLLLMARLGLRAPEVITFQFDDIDWRAGEILSGGKGKLHDRMPLPAEVGEAIVDYIKHERKGASRALFVSAKTPHPPFKDAQIVSALLCDAFEKTGLKPPRKWVGSHLLRHSLAMEMLRKRRVARRDRRRAAPSLANDQDHLRQA